MLIVAVLGALFSSLLGVSMIQLAEPFARQVLHEGAGKYGLLVAAYGAGAITGSVITVARGDVIRRSTLTVVGFAIFVAAELTFGLAPVYALALLGMYGIGLAQSFAMVACQTAVQVNVDEHYRGRVLSVYVMSFFAGTPIGALDRRASWRRSSGCGRRSSVSAVLLAVAVIVTMLRYPWFRVLDETRMGFDGHRRASRRCRPRHGRPPHRGAARVVDRATRRRTPPSSGRRRSPCPRSWGRWPSCRGPCRSTSGAQPLAK